MFNKTKSFLLSYPDAGVIRWINTNMLIFAVFVGLHAWLHFSPLTIIIVATLSLWIGMGFLTLVGLAKAIYDNEMKRAKRTFMLVLCTIWLLVMLIGPILVFLMYFGVIPFPPE